VTTGFSSKALQADSSSTAAASAGAPVEELKSKPLPEGAIEAVYGGKVSANHTANFIEAMQSRKQPISDVWS
jgi:hypothetical protein